MPARRARVSPPLLPAAPAAPHHPLPSFDFRLAGWPPSKSNRYKIVGTRGAQAHLHLASTRAVHDFEGDVAVAVTAEVQRRKLIPILTVHPSPYLRGGRLVQPRPRVSNPLFGPDVEVDVAVELYEPFRTTRDTDGVLKLLLDAMQKAGVYRNDAQIGDLLVQRPWHRYGRDDQLQAEEIHVTVTAVPIPSWSRNLGKRPVGTAVAARWVALHAELRALSQPEGGPS